MTSEILVVLGVGVLSFAFRSIHHQVAFRLGTFGLVITSFLAGWLLGGTVGLGTVLFTLLIGQSIAIALGVVSRVTSR